MKRIRTFAAAFGMLIVVGCTPAPPRSDSTPPPAPIVAAPAPTPPQAAAPPPIAAPVESAPAPAPPAPIVAPPPPRVVAKPKAPKPAIAKPSAPPAVAPPVVAAPEAKALGALADLHGQVVLDAGAGQSIEADEIEDAVVYFVPSAGSAGVKPGSFSIYTKNKRFDPGLLVIPVGSTVKFPNQDEILHNVFSTTSGSSFDLGVYGGGESGEYTFRKPGLVLVHCNVHESMLANILVLNTPWFTRPDKVGRFSIPGVAAGAGKLMVWHPRAARPALLALTMPDVDAPSIHVPIVKARVPAHLNKEGKAYHQDIKSAGAR